MKKFTSERLELVRNAAIVGDFIWLNISLMVIYALADWGEPEAELPSLTAYLTVASLSYVPCISIFRVILHYRIVRSEQIVSRLLGAVGLHMALFITVLSLVGIPIVSLPVLAGFYGLFTCLLIVWRLGLRHVVKVRRMHGHNIRTVILVGGGDNMYELSRVMSDVSYGYKVAETFFAGDEEGSYPAAPAYPAEMERLRSWLSTHAVEEVYCGLPSAGKEDVLALIRYCENNLIRFYSVPNVRNYVKRRLRLTLLEDVPVLSIRREPLQRPMNRLLKRSFDLLCSTLFLVTLFPIIYITVGIIIKLTSPGPVFFKQERNGENGKVFVCYKFRSMKVNKDADRLQATKDDPRKTKFGNFLRKSNIDELPQFINVFRGEMSLVGPRPHMLKHTEEYSALINKYMMRHLVKPGITGWAQVTGFRGETKELSQMEGRVRRDLWYVENWTFLLDLRILAMTVINAFRGEKNAY